MVAEVERWAESGRADSPETRALADIAERHSLSPQPFLDLCAAMRHDLAREIIETDEDLELYCQRTSGAIAVVLSQIHGTSRPGGEFEMAMLGRAVQRTNILRDIDDDLAHGRIYIPRSAIERFGPPLPGARDELLRDQIARADVLYDQGMDALGVLTRGRQAGALSVALYREILREIEREGYGQRPGPVAVPAWRQRAIIAKHGFGVA